MNRLSCGSRTKTKAALSYDVALFPYRTSRHARYQGAILCGNLVFFVYPTHHHLERVVWQRPL